MRRLASNPYLNTPPTKLKRMLDGDKLSGKQKELAKKALKAWRTVGDYARFLNS